MNSYELRRWETKQRQQERADRLAAEAQATYSQAREMASVIPFGQPILVGHYSEQRDRNYRARINNKFGKSFELQKAAEEAARRASTTSNAISSDDPDAPDKLQERIARLEKQQAFMVDANKVYRSTASDDEKVAKLVEMGMAETSARGGLTPDFAGRIGFPSYALTNSGANIRRLKERLAAIERERETAEPKETQGDGYMIVEDPDENRLMICFDEIPSAERRTKLKSCGFKWSPSRKAWVRQLNNRARWCAEQAVS